MGTNNKGQGSNDGMVQMETAALKNKLNECYDVLHHSARNVQQTGAFERLWDLKEKALMEGQRTVSLPESMLSDLDTEVRNKPKLH